MSNYSIEKIKNLAREVSLREGCQLYDLEFLGGPSGRVLRVYIDKDSGPVSIDDCSNVSRGLNLLLDVEDVIPGGRYDLEVSSPGLERKLTEKWHYNKVVGQTVRLRLFEAIVAANGAKMKSVEGLLKQVNEESVVVTKNDQEWVVNWPQITKANVVFLPAPTGLQPPKKKR